MEGDAKLVGELLEERRVGRVTIGRGSSIGGNVWLTRSVSAGSNIIQAQTRSETFDHGAGI